MKLYVVIGRDTLEEEYPKIWAVKAFKSKEEAQALLSELVKAYEEMEQEQKRAEEILKFKWKDERDLTFKALYAWEYAFNQSKFAKLDPQCEYPSSPEYQILEVELEVKINE